MIKIRLPKPYQFINNSFFFVTIRIIINVRHQSLVEHYFKTLFLFVRKKKIIEMTNVWSQSLVKTSIITSFVFARMKIKIAINIRHHFLVEHCFKTLFLFVRKTKKKKKKSDGEEEVPARLLSGVTYRGELCQKGFLSLSRLYCVIKNNMLICFKVKKNLLQG